MILNHLMNEENKQVEQGVIRCDRLSLHQDYSTILNNISLNIPRGAVVGLVGRNGAGKSTLLRCLVGLAAPSSGEAYLLDCPSLALTDAVRARLGYVAQTPDLFEWMSVYDHLKTIGRAYPGWSEERCLILAVRLDLPLGRSVKQLSGGDQQKLAVVLALAHDPEIVILDEPVSNLDPMTRRNFMRSLFMECSANTELPSRECPPTIIISSHLLSDLERVVSHVAFMWEGQLQLIDTWDAMLEHLRVVPRNIGQLPPDALIFKNDKHCVIDTRRTDSAINIGHPLSLDELFVELNS